MDGVKHRAGAETLERAMSSFERYPTLWVALCIVVGDAHHSLWIEDEAKAEGLPHGMQPDE